MKTRLCFSGLVTAPKEAQIATRGQVAELIPEVRDLSYKERLEALDMPAMEKIVKGNLITAL